MGTRGPKPWPIERGFWERVGPPTARGCREWQGAKSLPGYGVLQRRAISDQPLLAHRVAWELRHGNIPKGMEVLHVCDNPPCCEDAHLFLGTTADNFADMVAKGRGWWQKASA